MKRALSALCLKTNQLCPYFICQYIYQVMSFKLLAFDRERRMSDRDKRRISVSALEINFLRNSLDVNKEKDIHFRSSDITNFPKISQVFHKKKKKVEQALAKTKQCKNISNLLQTFQNLTQKLSIAKKQLNIKKESLISDFSLQLKEIKQSLQSEQVSFSREMYDKMQESTINFQSRKRIIPKLKSKQQMVWANSLKTYYVSEVVRGVAGINQKALDHLTLSLQVLSKFQQAVLTQPKVHKQINLPLSPQNANKKVLILDLDETLIHCEDSRMSSEDLEFEIPIDESFEKVYVSIKPYALSFLKKAKKNFEIIIFTASQQSYADVILNQIDPENQLIDHRLYRNHCMKICNKIYSKDLSIINRDLSKTVLVDNSPFSYLYQLQNGVPILSYNGGQDNQLLVLEKYLEQLRKEQDVRNLNLRTFKLHKYKQYEDCQILAKQLYCSNSQPFDFHY